MTHYCNPPNEKRREGEVAAPPTPTFEGGKTLDASIAEVERAQAKSRSTIAAKLALMGATFRELQSGACIVGCAGVQRHFDNLSEVAAFVAQTETGASDKATAKATATLQAEFALKGWQLIPQPNGAFVARKWGRCKDLASLVEAQRFYDQIVGIK